MTRQKPNDLSDSEQSGRFLRDAQALIDAGELNPTDAESAMERVLKGQRRSEGDDAPAPHPVPPRSVANKKQRKSAKNEGSSG